MKVMKEFRLLFFEKVCYVLRKVSLCVQKKYIWIRSENSCFLKILTRVFRQEIKEKDPFYIRFSLEIN